MPSFCFGAIAVDSRERISRQLFTASCKCQECCMSSAKDVPETRGDTIAFLRQFPGPFCSFSFFWNQNQMLGYFLPSFPSFVILLQSHLPACLIKLNYCFGHGPPCSAAEAVNDWEQSSSLLQLFLKMGLGASSTFRWVLLQKPFSFSLSVE